MLLLSSLRSWMNIARSVVMIHQFILTKSYLLIIRVLLGLGVALIGQATVKAESIDVDELVPILNLILEDEVECPSTDFDATQVVINDGILVGFGDLLNVEGDFDANDLNGFLVQESVFISNQQDIDQLEGIIRIDGALAFTVDAQSVEFDFSPLNSLVEVTGDVSINVGNTQMSDIDCLKTVGGDFRMQSSSNLTSITGFRSLQSVGENFSIINNNALNRVNGFPSLESVGADFSVAGNDNLVSIGGFNNLKTVGDDAFLANESDLEYISGFQNLMSIGGDLRISDSQSLKRIDGFRSLISIGNDFQIFANEGPASIHAFPLLESLGDDLTIWGNPDLLGLGSLAQLSRDDVFGDIIIFDNASFDCGNPVPVFLAATTSINNAVDCVQDNILQTVNLRNSVALEIPDSGSVSSVIDIPVDASNTVSNTVRSLEVDIDISHTAVGDLTITLSNGITTINLLDAPSFVSDDGILADIANACIDTPIEDDFLEVSNTSFDDSSFVSFQTIDAGCSLDLIRDLSSNSELLLCTSNNINVRLTDEDAVAEINTGCDEDDTDEAFPLIHYSPLEALSAFNNSDLRGAWTLTVTDSKAGDTGVLNSWGISFDLDRPAP